MFGRQFKLRRINGAEAEDKQYYVLDLILHCTYQQGELVDQNSFHTNAF